MKLMKMLASTSPSTASEPMLATEPTKQVIESGKLRDRPIQPITQPESAKI
jgi:hypothetical protein